jgi:hypothetical protein
MVQTASEAQSSVCQYSRNGEVVYRVLGGVSHLFVAQVKKIKYLNFPANLQPAYAADKVCCVNKHYT